MMRMVRLGVVVLVTLTLADTGFTAAEAVAPASPSDGGGGEAKAAQEGATTVGGDGKANPRQLHCLADKPTEPRFKLPADRVWAAEPGEADVCLWAGDRFAAMSITIDDNWAPDHPFWIDAGKKTGLKFTWFVITDNIKPRSFGGTWDDWKTLRDLGHDVQSHTVTHLSGKLEVEPEYRDSIAAIEKSLPGNRVLTLAYPGGTKLQNDRVLAAKYYIGARGGVGTPNKASQIDYLMTNSVGGRIDRAVTDAVLLGTSSIAWMGNKQYLRGWLCVHYHGVMDLGAKTEEERTAPYTKVLEDLQYIKSQEADLWFATFREVVLYGQERDTAKLNVTASAAREIRYTLTDDMDDAIFDYPLTVKVRLPDNWAAVSATQVGKATEVALVTHENGKFALVATVPDRGEVVLTPGQRE